MNGVRIIIETQFTSSDKEIIAPKTALKSFRRSIYQLRVEEEDLSMYIEMVCT
jgi:hypothetical protein